MSAEAVSQITSMGFSDAQARQALAASGGNIEASINWYFLSLVILNVKCC
jgi:uncharacterized UBP type Zn finger protein